MMVIGESVLPLVAAESRNPFRCLPHTEPFESAVFCADAFLSAGDPGQAYSLFFLAQDIAESAINKCHIPVAYFGRSLALTACRQFDFAVDQLAIGHSYFGKIDFENVEEYGGKAGDDDRLSEWMVRALAALVYAAISTSLNSNDPAIRKEMAVNALEHFQGITAHWENAYLLGNHAAELTFVPYAVKLLATAYHAAITGFPEAEGLFRQCIQHFKSRGLFREQLFGLKLCLQLFPNAHDEFSRAFESISEKAGPEATLHVHRSLRVTGSPFQMRRILEVSF